MTYYLAIDIGASSGRHILGSIQNGKLLLEEIYRFENEIKNIDGTLTWDVETLFASVKAGIKECKRLGKIPKTVAIDTWGVDYVLLDNNKKEIFPCVCYRDGRTEQAVKEVAKVISQGDLYRATGIQKLNFNTLYQLWCDKKSGKLKKAKHFLMMPDYLSFKLTGVIKNEYTNATTTNLVNAKTKDWDNDILQKLQLPRNIFSHLSLPGEEVGVFSDEIAKEVGFNSTVILCPSHDTASAVVACPINENSVYVSSGTWSLIGTENLEPQLSVEALKANFTNEGGIQYRYRFLKNIMGMWLFQSVRKSYKKDISYDEMMTLAMASDFKELIDPNHPSFNAPKNMIQAVRDYLGKPSLSFCDLLSSLYHSLANSYKIAIEEIEKISNKKIREIHVVGGGSKDSYLNHLTALYTGKKVLTGVKEGTSAGNLISQIMKDKGLSLEEAREIIRKTFDIKEFN